MQVCVCLSVAAFLHLAHLNATLKVHKEKPLHLRASDRGGGKAVLYVQATSLSLDMLAGILVKLHQKRFKAIVNLRTSVLCKPHGLHSFTSLRYLLH